MGQGDERGSQVLANGRRRKKEKERREKCQASASFQSFDSNEEDVPAP